MTLKKIDANIKSIVTSAAKLNGLIHATAMMIVEHAKEHGDCTRALTLAKAMPASMRRTMLVLWFDTFTPIRVVEKNDKVGILKAADKRFVDWDLEGAAATPFFELAEQNPEAKVLDFAALCKLVERLSAQIEKRIEDGKVEPADVDTAKAMAVSLKGLKFERVSKPANDEAPAGLNDLVLDEPKLLAVG